MCSAEVPIPYAKHLEDAALPCPTRSLARPPSDVVDGPLTATMFVMPSLGADMAAGTG